MQRGGLVRSRSWVWLFEIQFGHKQDYIHNLSCRSTGHQPELLALNHAWLHTAQEPVRIECRENKHDVIPTLSNGLKDISLRQATTDRPLFISLEVWLLPSNGDYAVASSKAEVFFVLFFRFAIPYSSINLAKSIILRPADSREPFA